MRSLIFTLLFALSFGLLNASESLENAPIKVVEVSIDGSISEAQVYVLRRAIREANSDDAQVLLININTFGGALDSTFKMMELISGFKGKTISYVNPNALSAGSFIANACDEVWLAPTAVIGAAEAVNEKGEGISEAMSRKVISANEAKIKAVSKLENPNRILVQRAMMDPDFELIIDGKTLKTKGTLLSLSAKEAVQILNGHPLLGNGIAQTAKEVLEKSFPKNSIFDVKKINPSSFENISKLIIDFTPLLMGIAMALVILELKSGGFGVFGTIAVSLFLLTFAGAFIGGLTGYEAPILFALGLILIAVEFFVLPGFFIFGIAGIALFIFSLILVLSGSLPSGGFLPSTNLFISGLGKFGIAVLVATFCILLLGKFFKDSPIGKIFVLDGGLGLGSQGELDTTVMGKKGIAISALVPNGKVEVDGKIYDAVSEDSAFVEKDSPVEVVAVESFNIKIKKI